MKQIQWGISSLALLVFLSGCNPFTQNIYQKFDKPEIPSLTSGAALASEFDNVAVIKEIASLPEEEVKKATDALEKTFTSDSASDEEKQKAALMQTDILLQAGGTGTTLKGLNSIVGEALDSSSGETPNYAEEPEKLISKIMGDDPKQEDVEKQLTAFLATYEALEVYGGTIGTEKKQENAEKTLGVTPGDLATKALLAGSVKFMMDEMTITGNATPTDEQKIEKLAELIVNPDETSDVEINLDGKTNINELIPVNLKPIVSAGVGDIDSLISGKEA